MKTTRNMLTVVMMLAAIGLAAGAVQAGITYDGFMSWQPTSAFNLGTFNASGSDKLVVVATGEHNFPNNLSGNIVNITYDGVGLTKAVEVNPADPATGGHGQTATDIWYLDNPGAVYTSGALAASVSGNGNNYVYTAIGLSGTLPGVGATATAPGAAAVNLTTTAADSMVIFNIGMGGQGNTASPLPGVTANSPAGAVTISGLEAGSNWAGHAVARADISSPGLQTFSFNTIKTDVATIAAEFLAAPTGGIAVGSTAGNWGLDWSNQPVEQLNVDKTATDRLPFDMEITVTGGVNPITIDESVLNHSGTLWTDFHFILGHGLGDQFVPVEATEGLMFLSGGSDVFPAGVQVSPGEFLFHGENLLPGDMANFQLHVSLPQGDPFTFTLREVPSVPEPATMALLGLAITGLGGYIRRRHPAKAVE